MDDPEAKTKELIAEHVLGLLRQANFTDEELAVIAEKWLDSLTDKPKRPFSLKREWRKLWPIEIWFEKRGLFKEYMAEAFFVGLFLASFEIFHRVVMRTSLEPNQIHLLNQTHFYLTYGSLVILCVGFIITLVKSGRGQTK